MKFFQVLPVALFLLVSCELQESIEKTDTTLDGAWQLKASYISPGGETSWVEITDGFRYVFNKNNTYQERTHENEIIQEGVYELKKDELFLYFTSKGVTDTLGYMVELGANELTLSPSYPNRCTEACLYRFSRP